MKSYTCEWRITLDADSPQDAVNKARAIQLNPMNTATHFHIYDEDADEYFEENAESPVVNLFIADDEENTHP